MSTTTGIEWTDATWNPVSGCTKVSQGCKHCYAETWAKRHFGEFSKDHNRAFTDIRTHLEKLTLPLTWQKPRRIFVNSMSDLFHEKIPDEFIDQVFAVMAEAQHHTFQVLTKRAERMAAYFAAPDLEDRITEAWVILAKDATSETDRSTWQIMLPLKNVWLGVSVEDLKTADERIPLLLQTPAAVRFLSCEPLFGPVDLRQFLNRRCAQCEGTASIPVPGGGKPCPRCFDVGQFVDPDQLSWVIVGGESGSGARPMHPAWVRSIRDQCLAAGVPFFFKQWGKHLPHGQCDTDGYITVYDPSGIWYRTVGKKAAGRLLDGRIWNEMPNK